MSWIISVPHWHPARLNELLGHWAAGARLKKRDRNMIAHYARQERIPVARGKRRVDICIILQKGQRAADVDAYHKSTLDALKKSGMIKDDNRQQCEITPVTFDRGTDNVWGTRIILTDIE